MDVEVIVTNEMRNLGQDIQNFLNRHPAATINAISQILARSGETVYTTIIYTK